MNGATSQTDRPTPGHFEGWLFFVVESLVVVAGFVGVVRNEALVLGPARLALLGAMVAAHLLFLWLSPRILHNRRQLLIYLALQAALTFGVALLTPGAWLAIALYMGLTGLAVAALWPDLRTVGVVILISLGLSTVHLVASWGWGELLRLLPTLGLIVVFVVVYVVLFARQTQARERAQELLAELEVAHAQLQEYADQVQELTLSQERERIAQELHDTLAQGVAGLILQLEAADSYLEGGNAPRAQETVQRAMALARTTLREARRAIQALRPAELEQQGLIDALGREVDAFAQRTGVPATFQVDAGAPEPSTAAALEILRILQESLNNVARHAGAAHVWVRLGAHDGRLRLAVRDDGVGFEPDRALNKRGSYGMRGMRERSARIGGELLLHSAPGEGTTVTLELEAEP